MDSTSFDRRESGIPVIGSLPWGTSFCYFYRNRADLLGVVAPYFRSGLASNERCVWVTATPSAVGMRRALERELPDLAADLKAGRLEVVPWRRWHRPSPEDAVVAALDDAVLHGFDGLRLVIGAPTQNEGIKTPDLYRLADTISDYNVMAVFTYPRRRLDAPGLMEVIKNYRFALVRNADQLEVIASSEARIAEAALTRSEERLRSLFDHMAEAFARHRIVLDDAGKPCDYVFLEVNEAFEKLVGLSARDVLGKRVTQAFPGIEKDPADWIGRFGKVALTGEPDHFESYSEPLQRWYSVSAFSTHKGFFTVIFSDINERKKAEQDLLRARDEWALTFDTVPDMIAILDTRHRVVRVNKAMAERLGKAPEECVGLLCYQAMHGTSQPPDFCPNTLTRQDGKEHVADIHEPRLGGDFLVSTTPMFEQGRLVGSVHVARDITERKRAEEELKRSNTELAASNRELEAFSYSVSHDLRAPLRSMRGFSQALLEDYADKLDEPGRQYLRYIHESSKLMGRLIDDLLKLSRVTRSDMSRERVNLSEMARQIVGELQKTEPSRKAQVSIAPDIMAYGDRSLLRVALENLLGNAWKFSSRAPSTAIEMGTVEHDGRLAYFVRDNGVGFDMAYADKLFAPFQRLHAEADFPGIGIGLATVQRIIRRHGGEVWADSTVGEGATFYFTLGS